MALVSWSGSYDGYYDKSDETGNRRNGRRIDENDPILSEKEESAPIAEREYGIPLMCNFYHAVYCYDQHFISDELGCVYKTSLSFAACVDAG